MSYAALLGFLANVHTMDIRHVLFWCQALEKCGPKMPKYFVRIVDIDMILLRLVTNLIRTYFT